MGVSFYWRRTLSCLAGIMLAVHGGAAASRASEVDTDEYTVRAALVVNLARFALWTDPVPDRFAICVTGEPALAAALNVLTQGKKIDGRPVQILTLHGPGDEVQCRVLYVGRDERHVPDLLVRTRHGVLTISDRSEFVNEGGVVRLFLRDDRVRFEINQQAAENAGIKIPAQVLALSSR
jgi:hypothetical protein